MALQIKMMATKPDNLSSFSRSYAVQRENWVSTHTYTRYDIFLKGLGNY